MADLERPLIATEELVAGYGRKEVLSGINVAVYQGEIVACVGHNGAGKSTLLKVLFGCNRKWRGRIIIDGHPIEQVRPRALLEIGIVFVPQGNRVFDDLTISENLILRKLIASGQRPTAAAVDQVVCMFPALRGRFSEKAGVLSGGEKQCLALASAFVCEPRVALLDEPSLGLAPSLAAEVFEAIRTLNTAAGLTVLMVEQRVREVLRISNRAYVLKEGRVSYDGPASDLANDAAKLGAVFSLAKCSHCQVDAGCIGSTCRN